VDKLSLLNVFNIPPIICGLFFIRHIIGKFTEPKALELFGVYGFKPPRFWLLVARGIAIVLTIGLVFGILPRYVAILGAIHLFVAAAATYRHNHKWLWHIGGVEYCI